MIDLPMFNCYRKIVAAIIPPTRPGQSLSDPGRLAVLWETGLLDTDPELAFDRYTDLVKRVLKCDIAQVSLVDDRRQFFKSKNDGTGVQCTVRETPLSHSFCQYVVTIGEVLRIDDARENPLVRDNPAVSELSVISYLGIPLRTDDGYTLGSLCAIGHTSREWTNEDLETLTAVAEAVMAEVRLRLTATVLGSLVESREAAERRRDELTHTLVHDLRTPVSSVISVVELLKSELTLNASQQELLSLAGETSQQMLGMLNGLLEVGQSEDGVQRIQLEPTSVLALLRKVFQTVKPLADKAGHRFIVCYPEKEVWVQTDPNLLSRVLINLLTNAIKFCPRGSALCLLGQRETRGTISFRVLDNGPGITAEDRERVFEKYYTKGASAESGSFGLGLAFCQQAVEALGGSIILQDAPGHGCDFSFGLPESPVAKAQG